MARNEDIERIIAERERSRPSIGARDPRFRPLDEQRTTVPAWIASKMPSGATRDLVRVAAHGLGQSGTTLLRFLDIPNRVFGNTRSRLQDIYESAERNMARDEFEDKSGVPQVGATAVHLASMGVAGRVLPAVFGANVGADTYETAKYAGASEGEALAKGVGHGAVDTAIWTLGQGLASKYLPKAWQWLGREITGAGRGAASSVTSDAVLNSLGADISGEEMAKRAVHAAWMVPLLGMLKMGGKRREEALSLLRKARPDLAGAKADKVVETIEAEFADPRSQKVALAWVARKGANLPDDTAQIRQALEVSSKVKGLDPMSKSPFEILSNPAYARYLPKPRPQDVKAFSNMKRYPMGVIGFDVSDDAAGRQATREMINAYMSPLSNPWCLATGKDAARLGELGPGAESYWKRHSAVPKQIFFQEVDGKLELTAFRATGPGGEGRQEYWDTSDAGYSGIPLKVKVPGDPMGRYRKMVFRPKAAYTSEADKEDQLLDLQIEREQFERDNMDPDGYMTPDDRRHLADLDRRMRELRDAKPANSTTDGEVQGTFEDIAPGKVFKGDPFRDGRSQTWVKSEPKTNPYTIRTEGDINSLIARGLLPEARRGDLYRALQNNLSNGEFLTVQGRSVSEGVGDYVLVEDKERVTENGITKFRTTKYADPTDWDYEPPKPGEQPKPVEIEESELVSPGWMRARGYDPESEVDVRRMQQDLGIQAWGNGAEAAMAIVPTRRTYMQTRSGAPETVTYGPNGRYAASVEFVRDGTPYRLEYLPFRIGRPDTVFELVQAGGGASSVPASPEFSRQPGEAPYRLLRNPDSPTPEVLDEVRWDEGLESYVRTSGNRRWRLGVDGDIDLSGISLTQDATRNHRITRAQADEAYRRYTTPGHGRSVFLNPSTGEFSTLPASVAGPRLVVEDRQPDGTWAPAVGRRVNAETGEVVELPPPPPATRTSDTRDVPFALKAGRTRRNVRAAEGGGDTPGAPETAVSETPVSEPPQNPGGPRIVLNPAVFHDKRDALCVTFNEAIRVVCELNGFEPVSEPTEKQRKFFADTAYADDELQLRRTILARIATLDTSVSDPTDEQLEETAEMLEMVMEVGAPQNEWEQQAVQRLHDIVVKAREGHAQGKGEPLPPSR